MGVGQLRWQCYRRYQQIHNPVLAGSVIFVGEEKREEYAKIRTKMRVVSSGKIGLTTVRGSNSTQHLLSGMPLVLQEKKTHPPLEQYIT